MKPLQKQNKESKGSTCLADTLVGVLDQWGVSKVRNPSYRPQTLSESILRLFVGES